MRDTEVDGSYGSGRSTVDIGSLFAERYAVEKQLGRGGMGVVFRVHDREVDDIIALKILDVAAATPAMVDRFRREVRLARRVTHRNAARTFDLGEFEGRRFLTMEFVDGESLHAFIRREPLSPGRAVDFARQITDGLAAAHEAGVVHRDLKPANIMLERSGRVVITDFGIARAFQDDDATLQTGGLIGTPAYMAPEQVVGDRVDARADVYALGLIFHEMLTGRLPFAANTPIATALARLHQPLPDFSADPKIPAAVVPLLERCLAREPEARPDDAASLRDLFTAMGEICERDPSTLHMPARTSTGQTTSRSRSSFGWTTPSGSGASTPTSRTLAVMPFRFRGPAAESYIAETLSDELIDVLSTTRGLRVSSSGATARFRDQQDRDPRILGAELGVEVIVDGTVHLLGKRIRIAARLLNVADGFQLWSARYDGALEDVFELQDKMSKRIAEALRLEIENLTHRGEAPLEAIEAYLRARQLARNWDWKGPTGAVAHYRTCLELAPEFKPALAGHAIACLRAWFVPRQREDEPDWERVACEAVDAAIAGAPELAQTHLAAGIHAAQHGVYADAGEHLSAALSIAPTYADAHDYLGRLQIEAGRPVQAIKHLELAHQYDPTQTHGFIDKARHYALNGDYPSYERALASYYATDPTRIGPVLLLELRVSAWRRDFELLQRKYDQLEALPLRFPLISFANLLFEPDASIEYLQEAIGRATFFTPNPRYTTLVHQLCAEASAFHGHHDIAMDQIQAAAGSVLCDLDWLEHCPVFVPLRGTPDFEQVRALVRTRAESIWSA